MEQTNLDSDQSPINSSEWGSDEDDLISETDIQNLDQCLADIFIDPQFSSFFTESSSDFSSSIGTDKNFSPTLTEQSNKDMFIMNRNHQGVSSFSLPNSIDRSKLSSFTSAFSPPASRTQTSNTDNTRKHDSTNDVGRETTTFYRTALISPTNSHQFDRRQLHPQYQPLQSETQLNQRQLLQGLFPTQNIQKPSPNILRASTQEMSLIQTERLVNITEETSFGFFTRFLLDENTHSNSIETYFDL